MANKSEFTLAEQKKIADAAGLNFYEFRRLARPRKHEYKIVRRIERKHAYNFVEDDELEHAKQVMKRDDRTQTAIGYRAKRFITIREEKNHKFEDALRVTATIDPPTPDTQVVFAEIDDYLGKKYRSLNGLILNIEVGFLETMAKYRTGEFRVNNATWDHDFKTNVQNMLNRWQFDAQAYDGSNLYAANMFRLWIFQDRGGLFAVPVISGFSPRDLLAKLFVPMNKDSNDCSIICMLKFSTSGLTDGGKVKITDMQDQFEEPAKIRSKLYKHDKPIAVDELDKQCEHFGINIKVWQVRGTKFECTYNYDEDFKQTANLLLSEKHYSLITNPALMEYVKCTVCRKWIRDLETHSVKCKFCMKCRRVYVGEHSANDCQWNKYNQGPGTFEKKMTALKLEKAFTADKNIIIADFETKPQADGSLMVYGASWQLDDEQGMITSGPEALNRFMNWCMKLKKIKRNYTLVFYNGSRFDLYFVNNRLQTHNVECKMLFTDGAYKRLEFNGIRTFDLNLHLIGSLKENCKAFGLEEDQQKGDFDHNKIKTWDDVQKHKQEWRAYLWQDIVSLKLCI
jgi:hypothetical protein